MIRFGEWTVTHTGSGEWRETSLGWEWAIDSEGDVYLEAHGDATIHLTSEDIREMSAAMAAHYSVSRTSG